MCLTKSALACGERLSKSIFTQINNIDSSVNLDYNFTFDTIEEVIDYIKTDENKLLDAFNMLVILDGAFNHLHTEQQKAFSFLLLQNLLNEMGYTKLELVLLTKYDVFYEKVKETNANSSNICYRDTEVLLSRKIGIKILTKVLLGDYNNTGLKSAR